MRREALHMIECQLRGQTGELVVSSGAPIFPGEAPRRFDSRLEERFAADLMKLAPEWELIREPEPIAARGTLVFPDFLLRNGERTLSVEVVGFWTPDYIAQKLSAAPTNLVLCIDDERQCADGDLPPGARVVRYRRRIDPRAVLALCR